MKPEFYRLSKKTGACVLEVHPLMLPQRMQFLLLDISGACGT
jgi:hypothetical protein